MRLERTTAWRLFEIVLQSISEPRGGNAD